MKAYEAGLIANLICVFIAALYLGLLEAIGERRSLRRTAFAFPLLHAALCLVAGAGALVWFAVCDEPMYHDACVPLILNPLALYLYHSQSWADLSAGLVAYPMVRFVGLPSAIGLFGGCAVWFLIGWVCDRVLTSFRHPATRS